MATLAKFVLFGGALSACFSLHAQFDFTRIVDTSTPIPDGSGAFTSLRSAVFNGGTVVFVGDGAGQQGVYSSKGGTLTRVADRNTAIPSASGNFTNFTTYAYTVDGDKIAFFGAGVGVTGFYISENGTLSRAIDSTAQVPGRTENFTVLGGVALADGKVAFTGGVGSYRGVYVLDNSAVTKFYDNETRYPGQDVNIFFSGELAYGDGHVAGWVNSGSLAAIVSANGSGISIVADKSDNPPGQTTPYTGFQNPPIIADGKIIFFGSYNGGHGIYSANFDGSNLTRLVDRSMTAPALNVPFGPLQGFSYADGTLAFTSVIDGVYSLYILQNGQFTPIYASGGTLDSKTVNFVGVSRKAIGKGELVFSVTFTDNSGAIYKTTIGSVPQTPELVIDLNSLTYSQGQFSFAFSGETGQEYEIQYKNALDASLWQTLTNFTYSTRARIIDTNAVSPLSIYRAVAR